MTNRFLNSASVLNLTNGSIDIYASTLSASNLLPSLPVRTNASKILTTGLLQIGDIQGLQSALNVDAQPLCNPTAAPLFASNTNPIIFNLSSVNCNRGLINKASVVAGSIFTFNSSVQLNIIVGARFNFDVNFGGTNNVLLGNLEFFPTGAPGASISIFCNSLITIQIISATGGDTYNYVVSGVLSVYNYPSPLYRESINCTTIRTSITPGDIDWEQTIVIDNGTLATYTADRYNLSVVKVK